MQKAFVIILLAITAICTFTPCCLDTCDEITQISQNHEHDDKPDSGCSPFFACATCPCFVEVTIPLQLTSPVTEKPVYNTPVIQFTLSSYSGSFWQPPRIC